jgi:DUF971 family protein
MKATPTKIKPYNSQELMVSWNNGETYRIPYREVRFLCPCAGCVDEKTGKRTIRRESVQAGIRPTDVKPVGQYAIRFYWSDAHSSGMYHFDSLKEICSKHGLLIDSENLSN